MQRTSSEGFKEVPYELDKEESKEPPRGEGSSGEPDKYYKKFDFFYKRTCFRLMAEFYKLLFNPFQKQWVEQKKRSAMNNLISAFASQYFQPLLNALSSKKQLQQEFLTTLLVVVHSHRHNKREDFLSDKLDFSVVRDTMYKYSKKAQQRFFSFPYLAFLLAWFAQSPEGLHFVYQKYQDKGLDYFEKIKGEVLELRDEAVEMLRHAKADVLLAALK